MRIDRLEIQNFKGFAQQTVTFDPHFTLLVGGNGSGKTSVLDALAIAASVWLVEPPDPSLRSSCRNIEEHEIRLEAAVAGDRTQFRKVAPAVIHAWGNPGGELGEQEWVRPEGPNREILTLTMELRQVFYLAFHGGGTLPLLAYYAAERARLEREPQLNKRGNGPPMRLDAFRECFDGRIHFDRLAEWVRREALARGNRGGKWRPGFLAVRQAVIQCVEGADDLWFDADLDEMVLRIDGSAQPLSNLSAGQRMMMAMVADIAIKAVTLNAHLLSDADDASFYRVLDETPGLVLIDELDVHLHPKWQRRAAGDLKRTFPAMQFVCTSHSPQVIGELQPSEIQLLRGDEIITPTRSFGMDSNRVLEELMGAQSRESSVQALLDEVFRLIDQEDLAGAREALSRLRESLGGDDAELVRAESLISFLEMAP